MLSTTQYFKGLKTFDFQTLMKTYRRHNEHYVLILKALPMLCAVVASLKIAFDPVHRDLRRDTLRASYLLWPCILISGLLVPKLYPQKTQVQSSLHTLSKQFYKNDSLRDEPRPTHIGSAFQDYLAILRTASYLIEAVAIVPQLYMHYGRRIHAARDRPAAAAGTARRPGPGQDSEGEEEGEDSWALDCHLVARGVFRAVYVACWLSKSAPAAPRLRVAPAAHAHVHPRTRPPATPQHHKPTRPPAPSSAQTRMQTRARGRAAARRPRISADARERACAAGRARQAWGRGGGPGRVPGQS